MKKTLFKFALWLANKTKPSLDISMSDVVEENQNKSELQKFKEHECVEKGHIWRSYGIKNSDNDKISTKERCFCARCGQKYHKHIYKQF